MKKHLEIELQHSNQLHFHQNKLQWTPKQAKRHNHLAGYRATKIAPTYAQRVGIKVKVKPAEANVFGGTNRRKTKQKGWPSKPFPEV